MTVANIGNPEYFIDRTLYQGDVELTVDELETILDRCSQMFASHATCEEREKAVLTAVNGLKDSFTEMKDAAAALSLIVTNIHAELRSTTYEHDARIKLIEACHKRQQKMYSVQIATAALIVGIVSQADHIAKFLFR